MEMLSVTTWECKNITILLYLYEMTSRLILQYLQKKNWLLAVWNAVLNSVGDESSRVKNERDVRSWLDTKKQGKICFLDMCNGKDILVFGITPSNTDDRE